MGERTEEIEPMTGLWLDVTRLEDTKTRLRFRWQQKIELGTVREIQERFARWCFRRYHPSKYLNWPPEIIDALNQGYQNILDSLLDEELFDKLVHGK